MNPDQTAPKYIVCNIGCLRSSADEREQTTKVETDRKRVNMNGRFTFEQIHYTKEQIFLPKSGET